MKGAKTVFLMVVLLSEAARGLKCYKCANTRNKNDLVKQCDDRNKEIEETDDERAKCRVYKKGGKVIYFFDLRCFYECYFVSFCKVAFNC